MLFLTLESMIHYTNICSQFVTWTLIFQTVVLLLLVWTIYTQFIYVHISPLSNLPSTTFIPIVGSVPSLINSEIGEYTGKWMKKLHTSVLRFFWLFGQEKICVADADIINEILTHKSKFYEKSAKDYSLLKNLLGNGLVTSEGNLHKKNRRLCNGLFKMNVLKDFVPIFDQTSQDLVRGWLNKIHNTTTISNQSCLIPVEQELSNLTLDIIGKCAFGYEFNAVQSSDNLMTNNFKKIIGGFRLSWDLILCMLLPFIKTNYIREREDQIENANKVVYSVIKTKRKNIEQSENGTQELSLLTTLLESKDEETGDTMNDTQLRDEVMTFMLAGHETTSVALTWCLLMIAQHSDIQRKIRHEVNTVIKERKTLTFDDLEKLTFTNCFIQETMRLYPPVPLVVRRSSENNYIKDYYFPKGVGVDINIFLLHRNPKYWKNPTEFQPERFEDMSQICPHSYLPFLSGNRMCIGYKFALMEMKVALARLVSQFEFMVEANKQYKRKTCVTMKPEPDLVLIVQKINND